MQQKINNLFSFARPFIGVFFIFIIGNFVTPLSATGQQNQKTILKGKVIDAVTFNPLQGASVTYSASNITNTNTNGEFTLPVSDSSGTIHISFIGYKPATTRFKVSPKNIIVIALEQDETELQSVEISTGFQVLSKERSTGSFSKVNNNLLNQQTGSNILDRLEGVTSSVLFDKNSQRPGITIRGISSINASKAPLVVLDNFPYSGNIDNINPNDIASITVLKDAAATSIWGAQAGNGVIVINTKKGRLNQPATITFNGNTSFTGKPDIYRSRSFIKSGEFIDIEQKLFDRGYYNSILDNTSTYPVVSPVVEILDKQSKGLITESDASSQISKLKLNDVRKDIDKYLYQQGVSQQYALNVQGGTASTTYFLSLGYDNNENYLAAVNDRISLRSQNSFNLGKRLQLITGLTYTKENAISGKPEASSIMASKFLFPYASLASEAGDPLSLLQTYRDSYTDTAGGGYLLNWKYYPLEDYKHIQKKTGVEDISATIQLKYQLMKGLNAELIYQYERQLISSHNLRDESSFYTRDMINKFSQVDRASGNVRYGVPKGGILDISDNTMNSHNIRGQLNYNVSWKSHELIMIAGSETRLIKEEGKSYRSYGYDDELGIVNGLTDVVNRYPLYYGGTASIGGVNSFSGTLNRFISFYTNAAYTYKEKYTISGSVRKDMSNLFGVNTNDKGRPFWSVGGAWQISRESFYELDAIQYLKMRITYGYSGNVDNSRSAVTTIEYRVPNNRTGFPQAIIEKNGNPELRWEKDGMFNIGLDFSSKGQVVSGSIDYYLKKGVDLLGYAPIDLTTGLLPGTLFKNLASMKGSGIDVEINTRNIDRQFKWETTFLIGWNSNKVTDYYMKTTQGSDYVNSGTIISPVAGRPLYSILSYKWAGLNPMNGNPRGYVDNKISEDYTALTGTGTQVSDLVYSGPATPRVSGALRNTFSYKCFSVTANIIYKLGYYFRKTSVDYGSLFSGWQQNTDFSNRWKQPGDEKTTNIPSMVYPNPSTNRDAFYNYSEAVVDKADQIRLQYINLSYNFNMNHQGKTSLKALEVYTNFSNLGLLWKANKDSIDPDYDNAIPPALQVSIGVRATL